MTGGPHIVGLMVDISIVNWYLDGPWDFAESWLVTGDLLPTKYIPMK